MRDVAELPAEVASLIGSLLYLCTLVGFALVYVNNAPQPTTFQVKIVGLSLFTMLAVLSVVKSVYCILGSALFILIIFPLFFRSSLVNPLGALLKGVDEVDEGRRDVEIPVRFNDEIGRLTVNFNRMTRSLRAAEDELKGYA